MRQQRRFVDPVDELDEWLGFLGGGIRGLFHTILRCEERRVWVHDDVRDFPHWLSLRLGTTIYRARRYIACAHALQDLPLIERALETGHLGVDKVVELTRLATPQTEKDLIRWARRVSIATIRAKGDEATVQPIEVVRDVDRNRAVEYDWSMDGLEFYMNARMPALDGALVKAALDEFVDRLKSSVGESEGNEPCGSTIEQRRADALVMWAAGGTEGMKAVAPTLVVHGDLDTFAGKKSGVLEDGPALHPKIVEQISCDSRLQVVLTDGGRAVGIGNESPRIPAWMRRELDRRDRECAFPGCGLRADLHGHHVTPFPGGPTDLDNLILLCPRHHNFVHIYGWRVAVSQRPSDPVEVIWWRPDGRAFEPWAAPP